MGFCLNLNCWKLISYVCVRQKGRCLAEQTNRLLLNNWHEVANVPICDSCLQFLFACCKVMYSLFVGCWHSEITFTLYQHFLVIEYTVKVKDTVMKGRNRFTLMVENVKHTLYSFFSWPVSWLQQYIGIISVAHHQLFCSNEGSFSSSGIYNTTKSSHLTSFCTNSSTFLTSVFHVVIVFEGAWLFSFIHVRTADTATSICRKAGA